LSVDAPGSLHLERVTKVYDRLRAVDDVELRVEPGTFLSLLGPSGSGKTTLLMMVAGFATPDSGRILFDGHDISRLPPERRNFGMVFQGYALFPHLSVAENVAFSLRLRRQGRAEIEDKVSRILDVMQLGALKGRKPSQLSGGQQQRVALARALVFEPKVLLLDEPLSALDRKLRTELQWELRELHQRIGSTFLYVTHDQEEALSMSSEIAIVNRGRIVQCADPRTLYDRPRTHFVASFLGRANFIEGEVAAHQGDLTVVRTPERCFLVPGGEALPPGRRVLAAVRAEKMQASASEPTVGNRLPGRIISWSFVGASIHLQVETEFGRMEAGLPPDQDTITIEPRAALWLSWPVEAGMLIDDDRAGAPVERKG
jgi:putative spermidine/putrescine transport system ATP-binding protein